MLNTVAPGAAGRLLLVEPNEAVSAALARALRRHGWAVRETQSAASAVDVGLSWAPDVVLLAYSLPDMPPQALLARLRAENGPVLLVLSGLSHEERRASLMQAGADDVLGKPTSAGQITQHLGALRLRLGQLVVPT